MKRNKKYKIKRWSSCLFWAWIVTLIIFGLIVTYALISTTYSDTQSSSPTFLTYIFFADIGLGVLVFIGMIIFKALEKGRFKLLLVISVVSFIAIGSMVASAYLNGSAKNNYSPKTITSLKPTHAPTDIPINLTELSNKKPSSGSQTGEINGAIVFNLINQYRASKGIYFLEVSDQLCNFAEARADFLWKDLLATIENSSAGSHYGNKEYLIEWVKSGKLKAEFVDEDLAINADNNREVIEIWKRSPSHDASILRVNYENFTITKACVAVRNNGKNNLTVLILADQ